MPNQAPISLRLYSRLTQYLNYLKRLSPETLPDNMSATAIAEALNINDVVVRKDLAAVVGTGKPKTGYLTADLIHGLEEYLGYNNRSDAVLVGVGNLGKALMSYGNFNEYGLNIVAAFDSDPILVGTELNGKKVFDIRKLSALCKRMHVHIGIITTPAAYAQQVCNAMIEGGVRAIWNFAPVNLVIPENVVIKNEDMAASLALLTKQLEESFEKYGIN